MPTIATQFTSATVVAKANVYFDGGVVSHTLTTAEGARKTLGLIRPGSYHFNTDAAERMEIIDGSCRVTMDGAPSEQVYGAGTAFEVPSKSGFQISVDKGLCQYICSFLG